MENTKHDLYLLSYGLNPRRDMTIETLFLLRKVKHVYTIRTNPILTTFLDDEKIVYTDITYLYSSDKEWDAIYTNISRYIIEKAKQTKGICYLTYGNQMLFDKPVRLISDMATKAGLSVFISPALSFIDIIFSYLGISVGLTGLQVYDANDVVKNKCLIRTDSHCLLVQIGAFGSDNINERAVKRPDIFSPLINYLRGFYPSDHKIVVCDSDSSGLNPIFCEIPLCWFQLLTEAINYSTTIYLPPIKEGG